MTKTANAIDLTRNLIKFNTINPPGNERACAYFLKEVLEEADFDVQCYEFSKDRTTIVARCGIGDSQLPICFTGHLDAVPLGGRSWTVDPFGAEIYGDKLYGRGSSDMKAGVAAFIAAAVDLAPMLREGPGVLLIITAGEETGCEGAKHLAQLGGTIGAAGAIIVAEPTSNYPLLGHKGALWLSARATGVTSHGSMPDQGINAVYLGAGLVTKLADFGFNHPPHEVLGSPTLNVGTFVGGLNVNSVPDLAEIGIDIRTIPGMKHSETYEKVRQFLSIDAQDLSTIIDLIPVWTEPDQKWVTEVFNLVEPIIGELPTPCGASYFSDACVLQPAFGGVPTLILGPGEASKAHQTDEFCYVSRIEQATQIYTTLMRHWNMDALEGRADRSAPWKRSSTNNSLLDG